MEYFLDCRGLACPAPVLRTKEVIEGQRVTKITVQVDNPAARDNISRFLSRAGYKITLTQDKEGDFIITGEKEVKILSSLESLPSEHSSCPTVKDQTERILILIATDRLGREAELPSSVSNYSLSEALMRNFIATLKEMVGLWRIVFLNAGVRLTIDGAATLQALEELERSGVGILVCGTCLNFYNLLDRKRVGETTNMLDIITSMQLATKVITIT
ncbi:MAG: sulfurtransferase-like selenium metabolism protein YedF [Syntrophobacterales bacterium]|nr:sulfurtransferase-like selenium metabolism protein YedF [Syntrophobacterales bacterium]